MPYDSENKKLYVSSTKGISTSDVMQCLSDYRTSTNGRSVGMLCTSPNINIWAKNKPVRITSGAGITDDDRKAVNYGIEFPLYSWYNLFTTTNKVVTYNRPRGSSVSPPEPYRLGDFNGYSHTASCLDIYLTVDTKIYNSQGFEGRLQIYDGANQELKLSDFSCRYATNSAATKPLSEFYVMIVFAFGSTYAILNTKKTPGEMVGLPFDFKVTASNIKLDVGTKISIVACLAYSNAIPEGFTKVYQSTGDYNSVYFIPLNMTDKLEAEEGRVVEQFKFFDQIWLGFNTNNVQPPVSGSNYYKISDDMSIVTKNPWKLQNTFQFNFYIKRGTQTITASSGSSTFERTVTLPETPNGLGLQMASIGVVNVMPITTTRTGDELWLNLKVLDNNSQYQTVLTQKIYTH